MKNSYDGFMSIFERTERKISKLENYVNQDRKKEKIEEKQNKTKNRVSKG